MKQMRGIRWGVVAAAAALAGAAHAEAVVGFARYKPIIERAPFGAAVTEAAPGASAVSPAAEAMARTMRLAMLIFEDDGTVRAGVVNLQTQQTQILTAGEIGEDGMELVEVRTEREEAVLRRGTELVTLRMEAAAEVAPRASGRPTAPGRGGRAARTPPTARTPVQPYTPPAETEKPLVQVVSPHLPTMDPPPPTLQGAELEKHLREYNLQAIRQGMPPLPIPLTAEEDATLVQEGVLPPNP